MGRAKSSTGGYFIYRFVILLCGALVLSSWNQAWSQSETSEAADFAATISGVYDAEVSGPGVLKFLPEAGFDKQGYFFLADGQGLRPHGVTFVLPRGVTTGRHILASPSPLALGTVPSVRVDRDTGSAVVSAEHNTEGYLELIAFPENVSKLAGDEVAGYFKFDTEDSKGNRITVQGVFAFQAQ